MKEKALKLLCFTDKHIEKIQQFIKEFQLDDNNLLETVIEYYFYNDNNLFESVVAELLTQLEGKLEKNIPNFNRDKFHSNVFCNIGNIGVQVKYNYHIAKNWNELIDIIQKVETENTNNLIGSDIKATIVGIENDEYIIKIGNSKCKISKKDVNTSLTN